MAQKERTENQNMEQNRTKQNKTTSFLNFLNFDSS